MKLIKVVLLLLSISLFEVGCANDPRADLPETGSFGEAFTKDTAVLDVANGLQLDSAQIQANQITGVVEKYCKGEGCWLTLKSGDSYIKVNTADKKFILPKNLDGKKVIAKGQFVESKKAEGPRYVFEATGIVIE